MCQQFIHHLQCRWPFADFFTWVALGDVDVCFSLMLVTKADAVEEETK
jgi:hypothetical protein